MAIAELCCAVSSKVMAKYCLAKCGYAIEHGTALQSAVKSVV